MTVRHLRPARVRQTSAPSPATPSAASPVTSSAKSRSASPSGGALGSDGAEAVLMAPADPQNAPAIALAREMYLARRRRGRYLSTDLFGEPTWDILLDLYVATREGRRVPTTSACIGADVPPTTALRWLRILESRGMVAREDDGRDGRRTFVYLTARGLSAMDGFLQGTLAALRRAIADPVPVAETPTGPFFLAAE